MKSRISFKLLVGVMVFLALAAWITVVRISGGSQAMLPDGTTVALSSVSFGTNLTLFPGRPWQRMIHNLVGPRGPAALRGLAPLHCAAFNTNGSMAVALVRRAGTGGATLASPWNYRHQLIVLDAFGYEFSGLQRVTHFETVMGGGVQRVVGEHVLWEFQNFPRREKMARLRLYDINADGERNLLREYEIAVPKAARSGGLVSVSPSAASDMPSLRDAAVIADPGNLIPRDAFNPAAGAIIKLPADPGKTPKFVFKIPDESIPGAGWIPIACEIADASGNQAAGVISSEVPAASAAEQAAAAMRSIPFGSGAALPSGGGPWRVDVKFVQTADLTRTGIAPRISIPAGSANRIDLNQTIDLGGCVIQIRAITKVGERKGAAEADNRVSLFLETSAASLPAGHRLTVSRVADEQGRALPAPFIFVSDDNAFLLDSIPLEAFSDSRQLEVQFSICPARFASFTAEPAYGSAN